MHPSPHPYINITHACLPSPHLPSPLTLTPHPSRLIPLFITPTPPQANFAAAEGDSFVAAYLVELEALLKALRPHLAAEVRYTCCGATCYGSTSYGSTCYG